MSYSAGSMKLTVPWAKSGWGKLDVVNREFVEKLLSGGVTPSADQQLIGAHNAAAGTAQYTTDFSTDSGVTDNTPLISAVDAGANRYVVVNVAGAATAGPPETIGVQANVGDWWLSDGTQWHLFKIGAGAATFPEAPIDGTPYERQDAGWVPAGAATPFPEAPIDGMPYERQDAGWVPAGTSVLLDDGIGITIDDTVNPNIINLDPATPAELGGVTVQIRSLTQGLELDAAGDLSAPLATPDLAGSIVEPPADAKGYVRTTQLDGTSQWVPPAMAEIATHDELGLIYVKPDQGLALASDGQLALKPASDSEIGGMREPTPGPATWVRSGEMRWVPAPLAGRSSDPTVATETEIGVVYVPSDRGLQLGQDGMLTALIANDQKHGVILDAPALPDGKVYNRKFGQWVEASESGGMEEPPVDPVGAWGRTPDRGWVPVPVFDDLDPFVTDVPTNAIATYGRTGRGWVEITGPGGVPIDAALYVRVAGDQMTGSLMLDHEGALAMEAVTVSQLDRMEVEAGRGLSKIGKSINLEPATELEIGGIREPSGPGQFARNSNSEWVPVSTTSDPVTPLVPIGRSLINGLDSGYDDNLKAETIWVPLATDKLAGSIVEPPPDAKGYVRTTQLDGTSQWVPPALPPDSGVTIADYPPDPTTATPGDLWFESDTGALFCFYDDGDSVQWVETGTGAAGGIQEAPIDGTPYSRQDAGWVQASTAAAGAFLPLDGSSPMTGMLNANGGVTIPDDQMLSLGGFHWEFDVTWGNLTLLGNPLENIMTANLTTRAVDFFTTPTVLSVPIVMKTELDASDAYCRAELQAANDRIAQLEARLQALEGRLH